MKLKDPMPPAPPAITLCKLSPDDDLQVALQFPGLDAGERQVMWLLASAWNAYMKLPPTIPLPENEEFMRAIHDAQRVIMARAALHRFPPPGDINPTPHSG